MWKVLPVHDESGDRDGGRRGDGLSGRGSDCEHGVCAVSPDLSFPSLGTEFFDFGGIAGGGGSGGECQRRGFYKKDGSARLTGPARHRGTGDRRGDEGVGSGLCLFGHSGQGSRIFREEVSGDYGHVAGFGDRSGFAADSGGAGGPLSVWGSSGGSGGKNGVNGIVGLGGGCLHGIARGESVSE